MESVTRNKLDCLQFTFRGAALPRTLRMRDVSCIRLPFLETKKLLMHACLFLSFVKYVLSFGCKC